jgi:UDP-glucose 4-epimerase
MKARVLVTGGAGFIGSHVVDLLLQEGHEVAVLDDLSGGRRENVPRGATFFQGDIRDAAFLARVFAEVRPTHVSHQAAQVSVPRSIADPAQDADVNVLGLLRVLEEAARTGVERFVFASSGGLYGDVALPADEDAPLVPVVPYTVAKLAGEWYCRFYRKTRALPTLALRYANVYGPRQNTEGEAGVVAAFASALAEGRPCTVYGDGHYVRDFVFVEDVARANLFALFREPLPDAFALNISTGVGTDVLTVFRILADALQPGAQPHFAPDRPGDVRSNLLAPGRTARLGFAPAVPIEEGLRRTAVWFRERPR